MLEMTAAGKSRRKSGFSHRRWPPRTADAHKAGAINARPLRVSDLPRLSARADSIFTNVVLVSGRITGSWRRVAGRAEVLVSVQHLRPLSADERSAIDAAARRFGSFLGLPSRLEFTQR